ncbi:carbonic anhydrase [Kribbella sp. NPDC049584]|uniref:carbonic anhydrase n=1 Tax=Kribbella sp. NPDC049584 TaxID=3154833 RepID=UPI00341B6D4F
MSAVETLLHRNQQFATTRFDRSLRMRPSMSSIVISCFDPRVDPAVVLGAEPGEIGVLRNLGGRVTPHTIQELVTLREIAQSTGSDIGPGWDIVVLQHTDCGTTRIKDRPDLLARTSASPRTSSTRNRSATRTSLSPMT